MTANYSDLTGVMDDAFKIAKATLDSSAVTTAQTFALPATGGTLTLQSEVDAKESSLGNPASDGQVLSSTAAGVRSWITPSGQLPFYKANGVLDTIPLTVDSKLPFYKSNSVASNIPLVT